MPLSDLWDDNIELSGDDDGNQQPVQQASGVQRTEKARIQRRINRYKKPLEEIREQEKVDQSKSWASRIQAQFFTPQFLTVPPSHDAFAEADRKTQGRERSRAAMSLLVQVLKMLVSLLSPSASAHEGRARVNCVLDCVALDDTSCRIRGSGDAMPSIHTVMNTVHTLHISSDDSSCQSVKIPTPYVCLPSQRTKDLHDGYCAYVLLSSKGLGRIFKALERACRTPQSLEAVLQSSKWRCQVMVGDSLKTNDAIFKHEQQALAKQDMKRRLAIRVRCQLHQLCLVRRPLVLSVARFWTTMVRLGHLFEQYSFKKQLALALIQILRAVGGFQRNLVCMDH